MEDKFDKNFIVTLNSMYNFKKICLRDLIILFKCIFEFSVIEGIKLDQSKIKSIFLNLDLFFSLSHDEYVNLVLEAINQKNNKKLLAYLKFKQYDIYSKTIREDNKLFNNDMHYYFLVTIYDISNKLLKLLLDNYFKGKTSFNELVIKLDFSGVEENNIEAKIQNCFNYIDSWILYERIKDYLINDFNYDSIKIKLIIT